MKVSLFCLWTRSEGGEKKGGHFFFRPEGRRAPISLSSLLSSAFLRKRKKKKREGEEADLSFVFPFSPSEGGGKGLLLSREADLASLE